MREVDTGTSAWVSAMKFFGDIQGWLYGGASTELRGLAAGFDPIKLFAAMAIAAVFGMVHALMPGHGKTVIVSYYLGRPAALLGSIGTSVILVLTHVGSAIVLVLTGFIVIRRTIGGAGRAPGFEIASAVLIIAIGLWLLFRALHRMSTCTWPRMGECWPSSPDWSRVPSPPLSWSTLLLRASLPPACW